MPKITQYESILNPVVTEKSTKLSEMSKVVFKVNSSANKKSVKKNIEKIFKVNVIKINTINLRGKTKVVRNRKVFKTSQKKAIVTLKKGQSIDLGTGV